MLKDPQPQLRDGNGAAALAVSVPWREVMGCSGQGQVGFDGQELVVTGPEALSLPQVCEQISGLVGRRVRFLDRPEDQFRSMLVEEGAVAVRPLSPTPWSG